MTRSKIVYVLYYIRNLKARETCERGLFKVRQEKISEKKVMVSNLARRKNIQVQTKRIKLTAREVRIKENSNSRGRYKNFPS